MRSRVNLISAVVAGILGCALLAQALAGAESRTFLFSSIGLLAFAVALVRKIQKDSARKKAPGGSAVRLAVRLAKLGQRTLLVEADGGVRLVRIEEAAAGPKLQYVGALAGGALILARRRE